MADARKNGRWLSELTLERYLLGELSVRERTRVERILNREETAAARLAALRRSNEEILASYPPEAMTAAIRARAAARSPRPFRLPPFALPLAAAALILITFLPLRGFVSSRDETRVKGLEAHLEVYRRRDGGAERLDAEARAAAGDLLQIAYVAGGSRYGVILTIDGRGAVTRHLPPPGAPDAAAPALETGGERPLPFAYQLDDAPGFERFILVSAADPFPVAPVWEAAAVLAADPEAARSEPLVLQQGLSQATLLLIKGETP